MRWHDKYAFTRRWKIRLRPIVCRIFGHWPVERWEEEKFDMRNIGKMEKVRFCWRCRCSLPATPDHTAERGEL